MTPPSDTHLLIHDVKLDPPPVWTPRRNTFGMGGGTLVYGPNWARAAAPDQPGTALLSSGASTVVQADLPADDLHAVTACTFFAQCAANAAWPDRFAQPVNWFTSYLTNLLSLGCFLNARETNIPINLNNERFDIDQIVIDLLQQLALPAAGSTLAVAAFKTLRGLGNDKQAHLLDDTSLQQNHLTLLYNQALRDGDDIRLVTMQIYGNLDVQKSSFLGLHFQNVNFSGHVQGSCYTFDQARFNTISGALYARIDPLIQTHVTQVPLRP